MLAKLGFSKAMIAKLVLFKTDIGCVIHGTESESSGGASSLPTRVTT